MRGGMRVSCLRIFLVIFSVYLYCPLFIQCPSVLHDRVCPSFYFRFSFFLRLGPCVLCRLCRRRCRRRRRLRRRRPSLRGEVHAFAHTCVSVPPNIASYIFQAMFTFEIKRGTNSGRRALMVTVQSVIAALKCG